MQSAKIKKPLFEFEKSLRAQNLIFPRDKILIACSGGPDSVALLHLLLGLRKKWKLRLGVLHFDHKLRGRASGRDAFFVRRLAKKYKLRFYEGSFPVKKWADSHRLSIEESARRLRYHFFCETARRRDFPKIVTAHTQNDQAETILMRILQGTGLRGLCGIRPRVTMSGVTFVRPLLSFSKQDVLDFLMENRISYRVDASNESVRFLRNKIRKRILPFLERELNPKALEALARIPAIVGAESRALDFCEEQAWKRVSGEEKNKKIHFRRKIFLALPEALQFRVLERGLKTLDPSSGLNFEAWQKVRQYLSAGRGSHSLPKDIDFFLNSKKMGLYKKFFQASPK